MWILFSNSIALKANTSLFAFLMFSASVFSQDQDIDTLKSNYKLLYELELDAKSFHY